LICLGIEGTAEKTGVGIVDSDGKIIAMAGKPMIPEKGGIHPREASEHHSYWIGKLINQVCEESELELRDIDLISFSRGPGLGPALRTVATASRALALSLNRPIIGVNHCIGHIEIGKLDTGAIDPLTLYVSGGNSQVIAYESGRYRIFGETLDIAIGNCLDHFGRETGLGHPAGPIVEDLAKKGTYIDLPYTVKGMDFSFSGLLSAGIRAYQKGANIEDVCYSLQETAFSTLVEVSERALSHTKKDELMLCGGVAANKRLREMLNTMANEHYCKFYMPEIKLCGDNGAMIAWLGILTYNHFGSMDIDKTNIIQKYRTDEVNVPWVKQSKNQIQLPKDLIAKGAEANIKESKWIDQPAIIKERIEKSYRITEIDKKIRKKRTKTEAKLLSEVKKLGVKSPILYDIDLKEKTITMEKIEGTLIKDILNKYEEKTNSNNLKNKKTNSNNLKNEKIAININGEELILKKEITDIFKEIGEKIAIFHNGDIIHGDLTSSNIFIDKDQNIIFIDFGLGKFSNLLEDKSTDLLVLKKSLQNIDYKTSKLLFKKVIEGYQSKTKNKTDKIEIKIKEIEKRGRYTV
jgi:N6-L-threonylcarbamoyladenine synthase/protein kinase Bud32